jgi:hypothetical protein
MSATGDCKGIAIPCSQSNYNSNNNFNNIQENIILNIQNNPINHSYFSIIKQVIAISLTVILLISLLIFYLAGIGYLTELIFLEKSVKDYHIMQQIMFRLAIILVWIRILFDIISLLSNKII